MFGDNIGAGFHLSPQGGYMNEERAMGGPQNSNYGGGQMRNRYGNSNNNQD